VFANHGEENEIYPLTTIEIAKVQQKDQELKVYYKQNAKTPQKDRFLTYQRHKSAMQE
jgi:hypothetical protein